MKILTKILIKILQDPWRSLKDFHQGTLIYDLNAMKGAMKSYLKKIEQAFKAEYFQAWKIAPSSVSLKNQKTVLSHLK